MTDVVPGSIGGPVAVIAHRGASAEAPEHTLDAYDLAVAQQADSIELDVRPTADGVLVCEHDETLARRAGVDARVDDLSWTELDELVREAGAPGMVRLDEMLDRLAAGVVPGLHVELKDPDRHAGEVEAGVVRLLRSRDLLDHPRLVVESFAAPSLERLKRSAPTVRIGLLWTRSSAGFGGQHLPDWADLSGPNLFTVFMDPGHVAWAHDRGLPVHVWTANEPEEVQELLDLGVDGIVTDTPAAVRTMVDR